MNIRVYAPIVLKLPRKPRKYMKRRVVGTEVRNYVYLLANRRRVRKILNTLKVKKEPND